MIWNLSKLVPCCVYQVLDSSCGAFFRHGFRARWDLPFVLFNTWLVLKIEIHPHKFQVSLSLSSESGKQMRAVIGMLRYYLRYFAFLKWVHTCSYQALPHLIHLWLHFYPSLAESWVSELNVQTNPNMYMFKHANPSQMTLTSLKKQNSCHGRVSTLWDQVPPCFLPCLCCRCHLSSFQVAWTARFAMYCESPVGTWAVKDTSIHGLIWGFH